MALPWVRLDTAWPQNPKFLQLAEDKHWRAITVYMGGLAWSGAQGQDGYIPAYALPMIHATRKEADQLVDVGLWHPAQGGWDINDWKDYQPSTEEHQRRSQRARENAAKRWRRDATGNASGNAIGIPDSNAVGIIPWRASSNASGNARTDGRTD